MTTLHPRLLEFVACPQCHGSLDHQAEPAQLRCTACKVAYPVRDGIPILLTDEARPLPG